jgi:energy-converting hydrogenase Eha subunit B
MTWKLTALVNLFWGKRVCTDPGSIIYIWSVLNVPVELLGNPVVKQNNFIFNMREASLIMERYLSPVSKAI